MIVGLIPADGGRIELDGKDITALPMHARARLGRGYLPQEASVFRKLSVKDNILAILALRKDLNADKRESELARLLSETIGRASRRERVCQYVKFDVVAVSFKKKTTEKTLRITNCRI